MKAKTQIASVYADCPKCGGSLADPDTGSHAIPVNQYNKDSEFECDDCGEKSKLEAKAFK